ncbi:MAG: L-ribulose-5-phosphate 4-epimerase AraD [Phycisphaerales bacterium]|nr:L-ribulose-5-phosphate 4-epimerase AraD [Phycisphaerales bacterium]
MDQLREAVCAANRALVMHALVTLTWGNVSGISRDRKLVAIKPSGVAYEQLQPRDITVVGLDGIPVSGSLRPSTDTATHLVLYRAFPGIGGITHTHSTYACMFAQARRAIPCLGTTHADQFNGEVPVTRQLTAAEVAAGYEAATGDVIAERLKGMDLAGVPGVLVAGHGPFSWGADPMKSVENAAALEAIAHMAYGTLALNQTSPLEAHILRKHHDRKHGPGAYYGQGS